MEVRYSPDANGFHAMNVQEFRRTFLIDSLFRPEEIPMVYSDIDRSITGSAVPVGTPLLLMGTKKEMAANSFAERREVGIINIGDPGAVTIDGKVFGMEHRDALYVGRGTKEIVFSSSSPATPAKFYFVSYPAHQAYPTTHARFVDAEPSRLGSVKDANKRTIYKYIHPAGIPSCQLVMGLTQLEEGSVWNTFPPHTHQRRSEVYMYFNLPPEAVVFHIMGEPEATRHLVMRNEQAVLNPSWSIHAGVASQAYTFIWAMGGENQVFDDMDGVQTRTLA
jgi:4-deoxy-L-threo-5-hexosulose-uronate ketol-isomerase